MFFQGEVLYLLRDPICPALLEVVHPLHNIIVFLELLLKEGVNVADSLSISVLVMLPSCVLDLLVVVKFQLAEDVLRVRIIHKGILFRGD